MATMPVDPDAGIPELIRRLKDDSKRLVSDEVRLLKLEAHDGLRVGGRGAMWIGVAFGVFVVTLVALTFTLVTLIGRLASGHMWVGAIVTGVLELVIAAVVAKRGLHALAEPSYSFEHTRDSIRRLKDEGANGRA